MERIDLKEGWYGSTMETERQKLEDPGTGKPVILRKMDFMYPPGVTKKPKKSDLLTQDFLKHLDNILWADNLERVLMPRVTFTKKGFSIFVPCHAKRGNMIPREFLEQMDRPIHERLQAQEKDNG